MKKPNPEEKAIDILCRINNGIITKEEFLKCSDYARKDLKRKCFILIKEAINICAYYDYKIKREHGDTFDLHDYQFSLYWIEVLDIIENL